MDRLLPCPFCGGEADWYEVKPGYGYVSCCVCDSAIGVLDFLVKADAIDAWNTRVERTCRREKHGTKMDGSPKLRCSLCGYGIGDKRWSFCPNCGAMVIEEDTDGRQ